MYNKIKYNKKGALAFVLIQSLGYLVALGLLFVVFNQVILVDYQPVIESQIANDSPERDHILAMNEEFLSYWRIVPILLVFTVMVYMFKSGVQQGIEK